MLIFLVNVIDDGERPYAHVHGNIAFSLLRALDSRPSAASRYSTPAAGCRVVL